MTGKFGWSRSRSRSKLGGGGFQQGGVHVQDEDSRMRMEKDAESSGEGKVTDSGSSSPWRSSFLFSSGSPRNTRVAKLSYTFLPSTPEYTFF